MTVIGVVPIFVALPLRATLIAVAPAAVPPAAVIVKVAESVAVLDTSTVTGEKVIPVAVGVRVIAAPAAARSKIRVMDPLATPPSTMEVAALNWTVVGPEQMQGCRCGPLGGIYPQDFGILILDIFVWIFFLDFFPKGIP